MDSSSSTLCWETKGNALLQMPSTDGQDLLALQKAIHTNHQSSRQKDWHPEKMTEIQPPVSGIIHALCLPLCSAEGRK